jgi:XTP/dITP diphosphohydrolase
VTRARDPLFSLVVATGNRGKLGELRALLAGLPFEVLGVAEVVTPPLVVEDADTFAGNALKKARAVASACRAVTLADDSGLEVDALGGRPGVRSARYARDGATDAENNAKLLVELEGVPVERRTARFRCALVLVDPWSRDAAGREVVVEGSLEGRIACEARGASGFGYDPLFLVGDGARTLAEFSEDQKNACSHRGQALVASRSRG